MKKIRWILVCWAVLQILCLSGAQALPTPKPAPQSTAAPEPASAPMPTPVSAAGPITAGWMEGFPDPAAFFGECQASLETGTDGLSLRVYPRADGWVVALTKYLQAVQQADGSWSVYDLAGHGCYLITSQGVNLILLPDWGEGILLMGNLDASPIVPATTPVPSPVIRPTGRWVQVTHREKCEICNGTGKCNICHGTGKYSLPGFEEYAVKCDPDCKYCENGYRTWTTQEWVTPAP